VAPSERPAGTREARERFPDAITSPAAVRRFVRQVLARWRVGVSARDEVVLLTDELASNAVEHATGGFTVALRYAKPTIRVEVFDCGAGLPAISHLPMDADRGRGLVLVDRLASGWGANAAAGGKVVWFELGVI
jgi:anti-sigma regulatory factor (Ser/Thr protein kinase)